MFDDLMQSNPAARDKRDTSTADVKQWAKRYWNLPEGSTLIVSELQCGEKDCPDVETVIAILEVEGADKTVKINKCIHEIREADIKAIDIWH